jgi:hypothetical protein
MPGNWEDRKLNRWKAGIPGSWEDIKSFSL